MRAGLQHARGQDSGLKAMQLSLRVLDSTEAFAIVKAFAISDPSIAAWGHDLAHANARCWLRATEAHKEAFAYSYEKLLVAARICVAEFEVFRKIWASCVAEHICKVSMAANTQITGWRQGRSSGL